MDSVIDESIAMSDDSGDDAPSYTWVVDNAIRSDTASCWEATSVHSFASVVDRAIRSDRAIRTPSNFGASLSPARSFSSVVDSAIRTPSIFGTSPSSVHAFALAVDPKAIPAAPSSHMISYAAGHDVVARSFSLAELIAATNNFSFDNMIGTGRFGTVYRGKLVDGSEVAIKRDGTLFRPSFELAFLSGLRHKNLVGLVGLCEENYERFFVYEYMENGALFHHLHEKGSSVLNSWRMRIKIALDASRGIEYLHNYAIPSIIHTDIKSSNILLDAIQTARVSDFVLSFISQEPDSDCEDTMVGTVGYIDPECYRRRIAVTTKSDVYGFGIVLLELLTGKRPIFKSGEDGCSPLSLVDLAVPIILAGYLVKILDPCVGPPNVNEAEALEIVAYTAIHCVNLKGKYRPTMFDIVVNLEQALDICCNGSYDSISSD